MQTEQNLTSIPQIQSAPLLTTLHGRVQELSENFREFVQSECKWTPQWFEFYLKHPEKCDPDDLKVILKITSALAQDLQALTARCKQFI